MPSTVLVIHGVSNRDHEAFNSRVRALGQSLNRTLGEDILPVFWGDLAPEEKQVFQSVPTDADTELLPTPGLESFEEAASEAVAEALAGRGASEGLEAPERLIAKTLEEIEAKGGEPVPEHTAAAVREAVGEAANEGAQLATSADLSEALADVVLLAAPNGEVYLEIDILGPVKKAIKSILNVADREAGRIAGRFGQWALRGLQSKLSPTYAKTIGDVLAYEARGDQIRGRLDQAYLKALARGEPVDIVAHSLGGWVTVEWLLGAPAVNGDESSTKFEDRKARRLVTFGSQPSLWAETHGLLGVDRRPAPPDDKPDVLPMKVEGWTNVWHQIDPLAFVMRHVLGVGPPSTNVKDAKLEMARIPRSLSDLSTHSSYWTDERFVGWLASHLA